MCGIGCWIDNDHGDNFSSLKREFSSLTERRGPNYSGNQIIECLPGGVKVEFFASVLHLRGHDISKQPIVDFDGNILLWNGEIYDGDVVVKTDQNDTVILSDYLLRTLRESHSFIDIISRIKGEFSVIFYEKKANKIWFCRDFFGRRSLLMIRRKSEGKFPFILASVAPSILTKEDLIVKEVDCMGIHCIDLTKMSLETVGWDPQIISMGSINREISSTNSAQLIQHHEITIDKNIVERTIELLKNSVSKRILNIQPQVSLSSSKSALFGILFSGGLDSMVLARLCDLIIKKDEEIDLINVAFENKRYLNALTNLPLSSLDHLSSNNFNVPDRQTGISGFLELKKLSNRKWNFICVNVTEEEASRNKEHIMRLMYPSTSIMDYSIATALWHAAKATGSIYPSEELYDSRVKVLLVGIGADEQLGGYSRHRRKWEISGVHGLLDELQRDLDRISYRNLGRDDRCISDHGKEARFPYLDEDLVAYWSSLPIDKKCNFSHPRGKGEKLLLRVVAQALDLQHSTAFLPKRAIQFGAKTAKMKNSRENGTDMASFV